MSIQPIGNGPASIPVSFSLTSEANKGNAKPPPGTPAETDPGKASATAQRPPSSQQLNDAVKSMNDFVGNINSSLKFSVDDKTGQTIVKVMDNDTKEVIKQIPSEEMLAIAQAVDKLKGLLVQQKA